MDKLERINKYLAEAGVTTRRDVDTLIHDGRVEVNGQPARIGQVVDTERDRVTVDGEWVDPSHPERNAIDAAALAEATRRPWWEEHNRQKAEREAAARQNPKSKLLRGKAAPSKAKAAASAKAAAEATAKAERRAENRRAKTFGEALADKQTLMNVKTRRVEGVNPKARALRDKRSKK